MPRNRCAAAMGSPFAQATLIRPGQVAGATVPLLRSTFSPASKDPAHGSEQVSVFPNTPGRSPSGSLLTFPGPPSGHGTVQTGNEVVATPRRSPSGPLTYSPGGARSSAGRQDRLPSPDQVRGQSGARLSSPEGPTLRRGNSQSSTALLAPAAVAIAASTPVLRGRFSGNSDAKVAPRLDGDASSVPVNKTSLLAGSSLGQLISKVTSVSMEREQEMKRHQAEQKEIDELLGRSKEELQQLVSVVSQLHELQQSAGDVVPDMIHLGPERPRPCGKPPFCWQPSQEYADEFEVSGESGEVVTKTSDFEDQGWVIPVSGSWRFSRGGIYRWTVRIERKCPSRPQLQLGIHGLNHSQPWRLVTTSRCSWSRDDEPWQDRPGGDRLIDEGDYVHMEVDMRGLHSAKHGTLSLAINDEPWEQYFDDVPLNSPYPLIPVISMGGDQSRVRLCPTY